MHKFEQKKGRSTFIELQANIVCKLVGVWQARARKLGLAAQECAEVEHLFLSEPHN